jgi:hypothetical protein
MVGNNQKHSECFKNIPKRGAGLLVNKTSFYQPGVYPLYGLLTVMLALNSSPSSSRYGPMKNQPFPRLAFLYSMASSNEAKSMVNSILANVILWLLLLFLELLFIVLSPYIYNIRIIWYETTKNIRNVLKHSEEGEHFSNSQLLF